MRSHIYTLIFFPIEQILEFSYLFAFRVTRNPGLSVIGLSIAVNTLILPIYLIADKKRLAEQEKQNRIKQKKEKIKAVFSGDERHMMLATLYRQHNYHPIYSLSSSIGLFIQIPVFITAYNFLSNLGMIKGISFGPIADLCKPDSLLAVKNFSINILPLVMTVVSFASTLICSKESSIKNDLPLFGMALFFLILLYNSPSGVVVYWIANILFSLARNCILETKNIKPFVPELNHENSKSTDIFLLSLFILFLLGGFVIPSTLIASSVQEFSFIKDYQSPFPFLFQTLLQSFGVFLLWPFCLYCLFSKKTKQKIVRLSLVLAFIAVINVFFFPGNYGIMTLQFELSESTISDSNSIIFNLLVVIIFVLLALFILVHYRKIMVSCLIIIFCALLLLAGVNVKTIYSEYQSYKILRTKEIVLSDEPMFHFYRTGKNVLVIMLDQFISGYVPYIFDEKPELYNSFSGFTWYKNTVSFGQFTNLGTPGLFGGYEYTPLEVQKRRDTLLKDKHNEALLLLPRIFLDHDFSVAVTDPPYANYSIFPDLSIYQDYPGFKAENVIGKYNESWLIGKENLINIANAIEIINYYLIRYSYFKIAPLLFRNFVYDHGNWLAPGEKELSKGIPQQTLDNYIALDILPEMTVINEDGLNSYIALVNQLPHYPFFLQAPDYILSNEISSKGEGPFADQEDYHVNIASLLMLGKWFDFLKKNDAYDNTRIIIVSDHGRNYHEGMPDNIILPNNMGLVNYQALLLVKDFYAKGNLTIDDTFMTNADVPLIALEGIVENPVNPFTGKVLMSEKADGAIITSSFQWQPRKNAYTHRINPTEWMHVHTNIFDIKNWSVFTVEEF